MTTTLKLTHSFETATCPTCDGRRWVPCPTTLAKNLPNERGHFLAPSAGKPIPCPECNGKGVVLR